MNKKDITSARGAIEWLRGQHDLLVVDKEVDPIYEVSGISKALDGGPAILFNKVKGYPGVRITTNVLANRERIARILGVPGPKDIKLKCLEALHKQIPPKVIRNAPCQEVVISKNINVNKTLPILKHTEEDGGRILGGGNTFIWKEGEGSHVGFNRMHFRGKDWGSMSINLSSHVEYHLLEARKTKSKLPLTINICTSPAIWLVSGGGMLQLSMPAGSDELAIAGGIQGAPVRISKAKTVDAYSIADAEWVIEGFVDTSKVVWETEEAEKMGKDDASDLFPEYTGYMGKARQTYKFQVTAITHRKDSPIFYAPLAHSLESNNLCSPLREASFLDVANRICPGLAKDVNILDSFKSWAGVVIQIKKRRKRDEGYQRNIILGAFAAATGLRWVIVVDEDVNIYDAEEILWALSTRVDPNKDIIINPALRGVDNFPFEKLESGTLRMGVSASVGFDATVPYNVSSKFKVGVYPKVDLKKWFTNEQISHAIAEQTVYARSMAEKRN